ncbi:PepSY-like domain-containing protein [Bacteroides sp. 214]|uniref:PepSY-like domain-containing protein n=1 Tax=Bacteroides sp. 214 TaxID=2302935 RepID=UPI0013CF6C1C|nr:PepSY-like domain-containing protein [Bacteroides sp. 214]
MKTKLFMFTLAVAGLFFVGCSDDDDNIKVDQTIQNAFEVQYPDVTRVEWEMKSGYYVADFKQNGMETEAWYSGQGIWKMTETDVLYKDIPQAVKSAFEASEYATWHVDDVDMLEMPDVETVYIIEVEKGKEEYDLYYTIDGVFVKAMVDTNGTYLPTTVLPAIKEFIAVKYPQARIVDIDQERNTVEVDIVDNKISREVVFDLNGEWMHTKTEVRQADVPQTVLNALATTQYGSWRIDDVDHYVTANSEYYEFEMESGKQEVLVKIDMNGNVL